MFSIGALIFFSELLEVLSKDVKDGKITGKEFKEFLNMLIPDDFEINLEDINGFFEFLREQLRRL